MLGLQLGLLAQLAGRGDHGVLVAVVADAGGELDHPSLAGVAVLPQAADPLLLVERQHDHGAGVLEHQPAEGLLGVTGPVHHVLAQRDHPVAVVALVGTRRRARSPARRRAARSGQGPPQAR